MNISFFWLSMDSRVLFQLFNRILFCVELVVGRFLYCLCMYSAYTIHTPSIHHPYTIHILAMKYLGLNLLSFLSYFLFCGFYFLSFLYDLWACFKNFYKAKYCVCFKIGHIKTFGNQGVVYFLFFDFCF